MSIKAIGETLRSYFQAQWLFSGVAWQNIESAPISNTAKSNGTGWVRFNVLFGQQFFIANNGDGTGLYRQVGTVVIEVYTPLHQNVELAENWSDLISDLFRTKEFPQDITFDSPAVNHIGPEEEWFHTNVTVSFDSDTNLTIT